MNIEDRRLVAEVLAGRTAAFGEIVLRYQDRLHNVAYRVLDNAEDAADVVQDVFVNAYLSLKSFKGDSELFTWLYRIAFNTAISWKRKRRGTVSLDAGRNGETTYEPPDRSNETSGAALERSEDERLLAEALVKMSPEHRSVLVLKDIDGLKYEEIAVALNVPIGTVRSRLHRARLELKQMLDPVALGYSEVIDPSDLPTPLETAI